MNGCTNLPSAYHTLDTVLGIRDTAMDNKDTFQLQGTHAASRLVEPGRI